MSTYIATFYSHFGAVRFKRELERCGLTAVMMPVPRKLSSSCGTCVRYEAGGPLPVKATEELEQVVSEENGDYRSWYRAKNS